jgi:GntR family transcriptional regulator
VHRQAEQSGNDMSIPAMRWALHRDTGSHTRKLVLLVLAEQSDVHGYSWPTHKCVAKKCELSWETVRQCIREMEHSGLLRRITRRRDDGSQCSNGYQLLMGSEHRAGKGGVVRRDGGTPPGCPGEADPPNEPPVRTTIEPPDRTNNNCTPSENEEQIALLPDASTENEEQIALLPDASTEIWEHYRATIKNGNRRKLDDRRRRIIRKALGVRTVDECKRAIDGLAQSAFHNGANSDRKEYLDIEYALGKRSESPDARIDAMMVNANVANDKPSSADLLSHLSLAQRERAGQLMQRVARWSHNPKHRGLKEVAQDALSQLRQEPYCIGFSPEGSENGSIAWQRVLS